MTTALDCRLLCACVCAYGIADDGSYPAPTGPYAAAAGWLAPPRVLVGGEDNIDACLVGRTADGVVVAFRGTLAPDNPDRWETLLDWLNDFDADLVLVPGLPGQVHDGFHRSLASLWPRLPEAVAAELAEAPGATVYVSGHSKGGALAAIAALRLKLQQGITPVLCTFAAPHPGDPQFADACTGQVGGTRYEFADDVVPHMPPAIALRGALALGPLSRLVGDRWRMDYAPVGTLRYIPRSGPIVGDSALLQASRQLELTGLLLRGEVSRIAADHDSRCGGGYMGGVCPEGVCP